MADWVHARTVRRARLLTAALAAAGLLAGIAVPAQAAQQKQAARAPALTRVRPARDLGTLAVHQVRAGNRDGHPYRPTETSWPAPGWSSLWLGAAKAPSPPLTGARQAASTDLFPAAVQEFAGSGPVFAQALAAGGGDVSGLRVHVLSHAAARAAGVNGVVFTAGPAAGSGGKVRLGISYAGFGQVYGGNYGLSLTLVQLPACALTTPRLAACQVEQRLDSVNDPAAQSVSAQVTLPAAAAARGLIVLAAAVTPTDGGGSAGTYSATALRTSGTWAQGGSSGSFNYSYPIAVPSAASSLAPSVSLNYDAGSVDGQTAATQTQASWAGDGWSTPASFIEQTFISCADDPEGAASGAPSGTADNCYDGPVLTLSLNGSSTPLVCPVPFSYTKTSSCTAAADDGEVVTHVVGSGNGSGTKFTDYWTVTERDGTVYDFGLNHLPGWASGDQAADSVDSEPVYSSHSGDPCYSSTSFADSGCTMAYRWNLDYVTDLHSNSMAYFYDQSASAYAADGNTTSAVPYIRDSHLDHIDYGFTSGNVYSTTAPPPDQVDFTTAPRCLSSASTCNGTASHTATYWPDVPWAQACTAGDGCQYEGPSFWSTVRLTGITTKQYNGTSYATVDSWALTQTFPATGDETSPTLWLASITQTGSDTTAGGSAVTLPAVSFTPTEMPNRSDPNNYPPLDRARISQIATETGSVISVSYELTSSCMSPDSPPSDTSDNASSCFPVFWQMFPGPGSPDWFNKYAVSSVTRSDPSGGSPGLYTSYTYSGAAWHYDDNELVQAKYRTYGQWRGYQDVKTLTGDGTDAQTESGTTYYQGMSDDNNSTAVSLTDSQGNKHADTNQLAGDALETTAYDYAGGPVEDSTIDSYWVSAAAATRNRTGLPTLTASATGQVEAWTRQAITDAGSTSWRETETDTSYDATPSDTNFGLPLFVLAHGDLSQPSQQTCTSVTYTAANTAKNLVGLTAATEVDAAACGGSSPDGSSAPGSGQVNALTAPASLSRPADVISDNRTYYDDPPVLSGGVAQPGNSTWPQAAPANGDASVRQQATGYTGSAFTYLTKSATAYDSYGRVVTAYDANGSKTTTAYTMTNGVTTSKKVTNPLGQATTTSYDPMHGIATSVTDPNGITSTLHYDGLGRLTEVWEYGRPSTDPANYIYTYDLSSSGPSVITTQQLNDESGYITSTTLYDALLRVRQTQIPTPQGGMLISDSFYDTRGWLRKANTSYWDSTGTPGRTVITVPDSQVPNQTVTAFNGLGRPVLVTSYDDSAVKSATATAYYGDRVTTVPASGGAPTSTVTDALGRITEIDQYTSPPTVTSSVSDDVTTVSITGGTTQATDYSYNARGEQSQIQSGGEDWDSTYNLLGEVTSRTDPDAGTTSMAYDNNGNLTSGTDANGNTVSYTYDALNRKTGEYDGPSNASPPIATRTYDNSNDVSGVTDAIGQLTTETSYNDGNAYAFQQTGFNAFGESLGETITLPAAEGTLAGSYTISHTYSSTTGLPLRDIYPASPGGGELPAETVVHGHETGFDLPDGLSSSLAAYVQNLTYTAFSQVAQEEIGTTTNNAYVTNTYDPHTGALTGSQTENTAVSSTPYDDTSYSYDPSGNITAATDTRNGTTTETQCFDYDSLDRLTQAWTATDVCAASPASNGGATVGDQITGSAYWTTWTFDVLGERAAETDHSLTGGQDTVTDYAYGTGQPSTLASTATTGPAGRSSASYRYDADGNTTIRDLPSGDQSLTWNPDGALATDTTAAGTTSYVYDADGNVLLQKDPGRNTLYIFGEQIVLNTSSGAVTGTRFLDLPGGGEVVRTGAGSDYSYEITNQQDTGVLTLSSSGQAPAWRQFTPYGAPRGAAPPAWPDSNGFVGKATDSNTDLTIIGARQYDPATGMFASLDPVLETTAPSQLNGYTYAAGNPVTNEDPSGLMLSCGTQACPHADNYAAEDSYDVHEAAHEGGWGDIGGGFLNAGYHLLRTAVVAGAYTNGVQAGMGAASELPARLPIGNPTKSGYTLGGASFDIALLFTDAGEEAGAAEDVGGGTGEDLYHFGRSPDGSEPIKGARHSDFDISNDSDMVGPYSPSAPTDEVGGASTYIDADRSGLSGHYYRLPAGTELPEELGVHADGEDVDGLQPWGHRTVYPIIEMPYSQFQELFQNLEWEYVGRIK